MIYLIYPYDKTLSGVEKIANHIHGVFPDKTILYRIEPNHSSKQYAYDIILEITAQDTLVIMGHGNTTGLHGAKGDSVGHPDYAEKEDIFTPEMVYCDESFIGVEQYPLLINKRIICYSCNSSDWLNKTEILSGIGFGIIPSTAFEAQSLGVSGVSEATASEINKIIDDSFAEALIQSIKGEFDMYQMRESLIVFLNRSIASILHEHRDKRPVLEALRKVISQIHFYGDASSKIA